MRSIWVRWRFYRHRYRMHCRQVRRTEAMKINDSLTKVTRKMVHIYRSVCLWVQDQPHDSLLEFAFPLTPREQEEGYTHGYMHHKYRTECKHINDITEFFWRCDRPNLQRLIDCAKRAIQFDYRKEQGWHHDVKVFMFFQYLQGSISDFFWYDVYGSAKGENFPLKVECRFLFHAMRTKLVNPLVNIVANYLHTSAQRMRSIMRLFFMMTNEEQNKLISHFNSHMCID